MNIAFMILKKRLSRIQGDILSVSFMIMSYWILFFSACFVSRGDWPWTVFCLDIILALSLFILARQIIQIIPHLVDLKWCKNMQSKSTGIWLEVWWPCKMFWVFQSNSLTTHPSHYKSWCRKEGIAIISFPLYLSPYFSLQCMYYHESNPSTGIGIAFQPRRQ